MYIPAHRLYNLIYNLGKMRLITVKHNFIRRAQERIHHAEIDRQRKKKHLLLLKKQNRSKNTFKYLINILFKI